MFPRLISFTQVQVTRPLSGWYGACLHRKHLQMHAMNTAQDQRNRFIAAGLIAAVAVFRVAFPTIAAERIDDTTLILFGAALVVYLVPWHLLSSFKAGGLELSIDWQRIQGVANAIDLPSVTNEILNRNIQALAPQLPQIRGARVLWIDDRPECVIGERRLLRALGVYVVPAKSSKEANEILASDSDFDLIITDVQRLGTSFKETGGTDIHEGVNYIVLLGRRENPVLKAMPVLFYGAYPWASLEEFTRPARALYPGARFCNSVDLLVKEVVLLLADSRSNPIKVPGKKEPTSPAGE